MKEGYILHTARELFKSYLKDGLPDMAQGVITLAENLYVMTEDEYNVKLRTLSYYDVPRHYSEDPKNEAKTRKIAGRHPDSERKDWHVFIVNRRNNVADWICADAIMTTIVSPARGILVEGGDIEFDRPWGPILLPEEFEQNRDLLHEALLKRYFGRRFEDAVEIPVPTDDD